MSRWKITVVGAGGLGAACAQGLAERDYADVTLVDPADGAARARALDTNHAGAVAGYEPRALGSDGYEETAGSEICVIASPASAIGADDPLEGGDALVEPVVKRLAERAPDAVLIVATDPLEAMCHAALDASGFPRQRVLGMGCSLDSARFRTYLASELGVSVRDVTGMMLGGRGEAMVPVAGSATVAGLPLGGRIETTRLDEIVDHTRDREAEPVEPGTPLYAPAAAVLEIVDAIVRDQMRILPCAALCQGEYGIRDLFVGVPCRIGANGVEEIVEIELADHELDALRAAADRVRGLVVEMTRLHAR